MIIPYPTGRAAGGKYRNGIDDAIYDDHATAEEQTHALMHEIDRRLGERRTVENYRAVLPAYRLLLAQDAAQQEENQ